MIKFADDVLQVNLFPWQRWLLIHMLELLPDNSLRFRKVFVLVARQNGKSLLSQVLGLWFMYVYGIALVLGTAQDLDTAEEVWQGAVDLVLAEDDDEALIRPDLAALVEKVTTTNGKFALVVKRAGTKRRWKVKAANRRAGRGLSGDVILLDELREHQSWDAWGAITKTTNARAFALILALSNAGDSTSIVLRHFRMIAHAALGDPDGICKAAEQGTEYEPDDDDLELSEFEDEWDDEDDDLDDEDDDEDEQDDSIGWFEWSARPDRPKNDREGWAEANPSLGYTVTEKVLASDCASDPPWVFMTECLCQWSGFTLSGPFPPGSWDAGRWKKTRKEPKPPSIVGNVKACVVMSHDRKTTAIAFAGHRADGLPHVEIVAQRAGSHWVEAWLLDEKRRGLIEEIAGRPKGPEGALLKKLTKAGLPVVEWAGDDLPGWTGEFYDLVKIGAVDKDDNPVGLRHLPQPALDVAAGNAVTKPAGMRFVWDAAKSPVDICTLIAATGAIGLLTRTPVKKQSTARIRTIGG